MSGYIVKRMGGVALNLVLVSILVFVWLGILPGDPVAAQLGVDARRTRSPSSARKRA